MKKFILYIFNPIFIFYCYSACAQNIFNEYDFQSYVSDQRAYTIGDTVTLLIYEVSSAESLVETEKDGGFDVGGGFSRISNQAGGVSDGSGRFERGTVDLSYGVASGMETERAGILKAQLSVEIKDIDDVGKFLIGGYQKIVINGEEQFISVSGWIRPSDIDQDNSVISTRLSGAEIEYSGVKPAYSEMGIIRRVWHTMKGVW